MSQYDLGQSTTTTHTITDFSVSPKQTEGAGEQEETYYDNPNFTKYNGYYKTIPELKKAVDALATWTLGKGWDADPEVTVILESMTGWGEDSFNSIMWNLLVTKKINGDAFAEIIRDPDSGELLNLKPLDPASMRVVADRKGRIKRYEQRTKTGEKDFSVRKLKPNEILHLCNDRIYDEIHGTSVIEACQWVIDARNEAMSDWRRISHRSTIRVLYVDIDNTTKLTTLKDQYADAIKNGEVLILPGKRGEIEFADLTLPPLEAFLGWIKYLEDFFYQALGVPKVILGGSSEFTEASSKIAYLTFEQVYAKEQIELEKDLWNQIFLRITFKKPASLSSEMLTSDYKNTGQTSFQPGEMMIGQGATP